MPLCGECGFGLMLRCRAVPSGAVLVPSGAVFPSGAIIVPVYGPAPPTVDSSIYAGRRLSVLQDPPLSAEGANWMQWNSPYWAQHQDVQPKLVASTLSMLARRSPCRYGL